MPNTQPSDTETPIVVQVVRYTYKHESVVGPARVVRGEPYVLCHHDSRDFTTLVLGLADTGHTFTVEVDDKPISLLEMAERKAKKV